MRIIIIKKKMKRIRTSSVTMFKLIFIGIIVFSIQSCQEGSSMEKLGEGYSYYDTGTIFKNILRRKESSYPPTDKFNLKYIKEENVYSKIISYSFNEKFILIIQEPNKRGHVVGIKFELEDVYSNEKSELIADSLINNDPYYQKVFSRELNYWIISHQEDSLYGPYSKQQYLKKREVLKIPEKLKLKDVD
ncbi:MAG: hypothetical protein HRT69_09025 [Flavobacteriaceae bacterium]|nr:hypothetical protein [Flavobacteriaceae bacterium]